MTFEQHRARTSAGDLAYVDEGDGPAALLVHGFPTSSHLWRDLVPMLAPRFRVIAPDLLGYGASGRRSDPAALTIRAQAAAVGELANALGFGELAVVGHDVGGGVAQLLALEGRATTIVVLDSIAFDAWPIDGVRMLQQVPEDQVDDEVVRGVVGVALETGMAEPGRLAPADRDAYLRPWLDDPPALVRAARGIDGVGLAGTESRLEALEARALVVWGEEDPFLPASLAERLGDAMPGATVGLIPGASHFVTEDAPESVLPLISEYLRVHHLREGHHHAEPTPIELGISFERPARPSPPEGFEDLA